MNLTDRIVAIHKALESGRIPQSMGCGKRNTGQHLAFGSCSRMRRSACERSKRKDPAVQKNSGPVSGHQGQLRVLKGRRMKEAGLMPGSYRPAQTVL